MPDTFRSNLDDADFLSAYPSPSSPLSIDELMKARAVSQPPSLSAFGPQASMLPPMQAAAAQPATPTAPILGDAKAAAAPVATVPAPTARDLMLSGANRVQQSMNDAAQADAQIATSNPEIDQLEQQRAAIAQPQPKYDPQTGKLLAQFQPTLGQRILRGVRSSAIGLLTGGIPGALVGAIEPQDIAGGQAYGDPNKAYQRGEETREAQLAATDQALQQARANWKSAVDAAKGKASEIRANAALGKDLGDLGKGILTSDTNAAKNQTQLRKLGYKFDENGEIVPLAYDEMAPDQQAQYDLRGAQQELATARAELARAQGDPNSPAYKLALAKEQTAEKNANAASERAQAYMLNATAGNLGTDTEGHPLQGATIMPESGLPTGSRFQGTVQRQQGRVAQFNDVLQATTNLENTARRLVQTRGPGALSEPVIAAAIAQPEGTFNQWAQAQVANRRMSPAQRDYVTNLRAFRENLQALRQSVGGGVSDAQVNRLMEMAPGANTPDLDYLLRQTGQIRSTAQRLSTGIPNVVGGHQVEGGAPAPAPHPAAPGNGSSDWFDQYLIKPEGKK